MFIVFFGGPLKKCNLGSTAHARCRHRDASERAKSRRAIGIRTFATFFGFFCGPLKNVFYEVGRMLGAATGTPRSEPNLAV